MFNWFKRKYKKSAQEWLLWLANQTVVNMTTMIEGFFKPAVDRGISRYGPADIRPIELAYLSLALVQYSFRKYSDFPTGERKYEVAARLRNQFLAQYATDKIPLPSLRTSYSERAKKFHEFFDEILSECPDEALGPLRLMYVYNCLFLGRAEAHVESTPFFLFAEFSYSAFRENFDVLKGVTSQLRDTVRNRGQV